MSDITIERLGGLAGFGLPGSRVRSQGTVSLGALTIASRAAVEDLFDPARNPRTEATGAADTFRFRLTRTTPNGAETVEVPEAAVPPELQSAVRTELR